MERDKWIISKFIRYIYPSKQQKKKIIDYDFDFRHSL